MNYFASYRLLCPTVKTIRIVLCFATFLCCSQVIQAQVEVSDTAITIIAPPELEDVTDTDIEQKITIPEEPPVLRQVSDSTVRDLQKKKEFAYANDPAYWAQQQKRQIQTQSEEPQKGFWDYFHSFFSSSAIKTITYGVLIAFFLFVIYRIIVVNKLFLFYSSKKAKTTATGEEISIEDDNLDEKIKNAVDSKDHRMAVRFMYLKALQLLNEKQWIRYHADGTNYEYVNQMSKHKLGSEFSSLTRVYDYMWYGEFTLTQEQFDVVYKNFSHFYNALHS
ncbi:DUF4129 domain-containing protein [Niastella caeni]|uniref:DUF4129 domain-containing protein n=1 Tax=Niastella caeni TaxID=2569763 RepID=A0A4S8HRE7_9BACT|nr:DUF4129 domain-containing protein [Niastella caeni]THU38077.1 DUF4129 domain-containing protein [Niastella caeni]